MEKTKEMRVIILGRESWSESLFSELKEIKEIGGVSLIIMDETQLEIEDKVMAKLKASIEEQIFDEWNPGKLPDTSIKLKPSHVGNYVEPCIKKSKRKAQWKSEIRGRR